MMEDQNYTLETHQCGYATAIAGLPSKVGKNSPCSAIAPPFHNNVFQSEAIGC